VWPRRPFAALLLPNLSGIFSLTKMEAEVIHSPSDWMGTAPPVTRTSAFPRSSLTDLPAFFPHFSVPLFLAGDASAPPRLPTPLDAVRASSSRFVPLISDDQLWDSYLFQLLAHS